MAPELTPIQRQLLRFIADRQERHLTVSMTDICDKFGWASSNSAWSHLAALKTKGAIENGEVLVKRRGFVITKAGREALR